MSISNLQKLVKNIETLLNENGSRDEKNRLIETFKNEDQETSKKYSSIFVVLESENLDRKDINRLSYMLDMASKVKNNAILEHDASVAVGQRLVDDIVKPQLKK